VAKVKTTYSCTECGASSPKWQGKCPGCNAWNTLVEVIAESVAGKRFVAIAEVSRLQMISEIETSEEDRLPTGIGEFDRTLGGGLVSGGVVLLGGDPGIGKSTLLLQALAGLSTKNRVLYMSGEESGKQVAMRARRLALNTQKLKLLTEINLGQILTALREEKPQAAVIDSIQTLWFDELSSAPGSVAQVRECAAQLTRLAKQTGISIILVGHVTKEGALAGPRVLEHIVDTVLYFEGDAHSSFRVIRAVKNRYGAANEIGVFAMTDKGLKGVNNPSAIFLSPHGQEVPGSCVLVTQEGTRPLLVEIQALVDQSYGHPRRLTVGIDAQRLSMLLAVLHRHAGILCFDQDVFVNAVGGLKISEPAADLAVLFSIISSLKNKALMSKLIVFGEVGLAGEIRPAPRGQERLKEAAKLGFTHALIPEANKPKQPIANIEVIGVKRVEDAVARMYELG